MPSADRPTALVTGSNGGIGLALARALAGRGWRVLLHGRDASKLEAARTSLGAPADDAFQADLADLDAVRALADAVRQRTGRLDVLVHNAGLVVPERRIAPSGAELTVAVHALAPFALTEALRPTLEATASAHGAARVVTVSSEAHRLGSLPDTPNALGAVLRGPTSADRYSSLMSYGTAKLAATTWTLELARRLEGSGVTANACHPGVVRTEVFRGVDGVVGLLARLASPLYLSARRGAESPLLLATDPRYAERSGRFVTQSRFRRPHEAEPPASALDPEAGVRLWNALSDLAGSS